MSGETKKIQEYYQSGLPISGPGDERGPPLPGYELGFAMFGENHEEVSVHKWLKRRHSNRLYSIANAEY